MLELVGTPEDRFSRVAAQMLSPVTVENMYFFLLFSISNFIGY